MTNAAADNSSPRGNGSGPHLSAGTFSAYIDDQLSPTERAAAETHLQTCSTCRQDLADLRATVNLLHALPEHRPVRSFQLGPEQAARRGIWLSQFFSEFAAFRVAAIAVSVLLIAVIGTDLLIHRGDQTQLQMAAQAPSTTNSALSQNAHESDDVQPQLGARPASTHPPAPVSAAREVQPTHSVESAPHPSVNAAAGGLAPAGAAGESEESAAAAPKSAASPTTSPVVAAAPTVTTVPSEQSTESSKSQSTGANHPSWWRMAEIALAVLLLWLIVSIIGLRRIRP